MSYDAYKIRPLSREEILLSSHAFALGIATALYETMVKTSQPGQIVGMLLDHLRAIEQAIDPQPKPESGE